MNWIETGDKYAANNGCLQIYITIPALIIVSVVQSLSRAFDVPRKFRTQQGQMKNSTNNVRSNICRLFRHIWQILIIRFYISSASKFLIIDKGRAELIRIFHGSWIMHYNIITKRKYQTPDGERDIYIIISPWYILGFCCMLRDL